MSASRSFYRVEQNQQFGRHLVAACDIPAGRVVLLQDPYACVLYDEAAAARCDHCLALCQRPLRCSKSKLARYCSRDHQRAAWQAGFNIESDALAALHPKVPPPTVRLAARCLLRRYREQQQAAETWSGAGPSSTYADVEQLLHHWDALDEQRKITYAQMAVLVKQYVAAALTSQSGQPIPPGAIPDVKHIAQLLARFACNNHTICDEELRPFGVGLYPLGALVNHSCTPNCVQGFNGQRILFRALRPIAAGEQLTISYGELAAPRLERRLQLLWQYFFDIDQGLLPGRDQPQQHGQEEQQQQHGQAQQDQQQQQQQLQVPPDLAALPPPDHTLQVSPDLTVWHYGCHPGAMDPADAALCQLLLSWHPLQGGMVLLKVVAPPPAAELDTLLAAAAEAAGGGGPDGAGMQQAKGVSPGAGDGAAAGAAAAAGQPAAAPSAAAAGGGGSSVAPAAVAAPEPAAAAGGGGGSSGVGPAGGDLDEEDLQALLSGLEGQATAAFRQQLQQRLVQQKQQGPGGGRTPGTYVAVSWDAASDTAAPAAEGTPSGAASSSAPSAAAGTQSGPAQGLGPPSPQVLLAGARLLSWVRTTTELGELLIDQGQAAAAVKLLGSALQLADGGKDLAVAVVGADGAEAAVTPRRPAVSTALHQLLQLQPRPQQKQVSLGRCHALRLRLLGALLRAAVSGGCWEAALGAARRLTPLLDQVYPRVWPSHGLHAATQAKLALLLGATQEAAGAAQSALEVLRVTHGDGPVLTQVMHTAYEAQQELRQQQQEAG